MKKTEGGCVSEWDTWPDSCVVFGRVSSHNTAALTNRSNSVNENHILLIPSSVVFLLNSVSVCVAGWELAAGITCADTALRLVIYVLECSANTEVGGWSLIGGIIWNLHILLTCWRSSVVGCWLGPLFVFDICAVCAADFDSDTS